MAELLLTDSILTTIKKELGLAEDYNAFDMDIIVFINSALSILYQMGLETTDSAFHITGATESWNDFLGDKTYLNLAKDEIFIRVKLMFDPPQISSVLEAYKRTLSELDWRITVAVEEGQNATTISNTLR